MQGHSLQARCAQGPGLVRILSQEAEALQYRAWERKVFLTHRDPGFREPLPFQERRTSCQR